MMRTPTSSIWPKIAVIWFAIIVILLTSCASYKKSDKQSTTKEQTVSEVKKDSVIKIDTSKPIEDRVVINVPKTDNKELMELFNSVMRQLNTSKSSGSNSYVSKYDENLMKWIIDFKIGETKDKESSSMAQTSTVKTTDQTIIETSSKLVKRIPWWIYAIVIVWFLPQIITRVNLIINPVASFLKKISSKK